MSFIGKRGSGRSTESGSRGGFRGNGGMRRNTSVPVAHIGMNQGRSAGIGKSIGRAVGRHEGGMIGGLIGSAIGGMVAETAGALITNAINDKIDEHEALKQAEMEAKFNATYDAAYDTTYDANYVDPNAKDEFGLTKDERMRYPSKCPSCLGAPDGSRYCPFCGSRLV